MPLDARPITDAEVKLLYEENGRVAAAFWEWRHKVMTFCFAAVPALVIASGWLYQQDLRRFIALPLALGAGIAFISGRLERRNGDVLSRCYAVGARLEECWLGTGNGAIYRALQQRRIFTGVLKPSYRVTVLALAALAVYTFFWPLHNA